MARRHDARARREARAASFFRQSAATYLRLAGDWLDKAERDHDRGDNERADQNAQLAVSYLRLSRARGDLAKISERSLSRQRWYARDLRDQALAEKARLA